MNAPHVIAMEKLKAELEKAVPRPPRFSRQLLLEDEIAMFRPDYNEAKELLDALEHGLESSMNDLVDEDVTHYFHKLREMLKAADTYDPTDQYNGDDD